MSELPEKRTEDYSEDERPMVVKEDAGQAEDFDRLNKLAEYLESSDDAFDNRMLSGNRVSSYDGERDKKLDAMNNTAARGINLVEHLLGQWACVETTAVCWMRRLPGAISATAGPPRPLHRVNTSTGIPCAANRPATSRTNTFIPPESPVPG